MTSLLDTRLRALDSDGACAAFSRIRRGIEKESLRVTLTGDLAQTPHPTALGSALALRPRTTSLKAPARPIASARAFRSIQTTATCSASGKLVRGLEV